jgi:predicted  nucleic acid-binding Zn-ribbon protein
MDESHGPTLVDVLAAIAGLRAEFDQYKARTTPLSETLEAIRVEVREVSMRLDGFEKRFDGFEKRFDGFEKRFDGFERRLGAVEQEVRDIKSSNRRIEHKIDGISIELAERKGTLHDHEERLMKIEG